MALKYITLKDDTIIVYSGRPLHGHIPPFMIRSMGTVENNKWVCYRDKDGQRDIDATMILRKDLGV